MPRRFLVVNYKVYETAFNETALSIAREAGRLSSRLSATEIILAVPSIMAPKISQIYDYVYLQHVDPVGFGAHTGYLPARALKWAGVRGTLVNHSEHKMPYRDVEAVVRDVKSLGLETLVCADTPGEAAGLAYLKPTMIAVEPPELIGTGIPVSKAKPEVITGGVEAVRKIDPSIPVLAGAGISAPEDAVRAVELGASGVLVASMVMKARDPPAAMRSLAEALETT